MARPSPTAEHAPGVSDPEADRAETRSWEQCHSPPGDEIELPGWVEPELPLLRGDGVSKGGLGRDRGKAQRRGKLRNQIEPAGNKAPPADSASVPAARSRGTDHCTRVEELARRVRQVSVFVEPELISEKIGKIVVNIEAVVGIEIIAYAVQRSSGVDQGVDRHAEHLRHVGDRHQSIKARWSFLSSGFG